MQFNNSVYIRKVALVENNCHITDYTDHDPLKKSSLSWSTYGRNKLMQM